MRQGAYPFRDLEANSPQAERAPRSRDTAFVTHPIGSIEFAGRLMRQGAYPLESRSVTLRRIRLKLKEHRNPETQPPRRSVGYAGFKPSHDWKHANWRSADVQTGIFGLSLLLSHFLDFTRLKTHINGAAIMTVQ